MPDMDADTRDARRLTRRESSDAVSGIGWRHVLGALLTSVPVGSLAQAAEVAARLVADAGSAADDHLVVDLRHDRVVLALRSRPTGTLTSVDVRLARAISATVGELGLRTEPDVDSGAPRSVQLVEIAIDAMDIPAIRPFWQAALSYVPDPGDPDPEGALVDPVGQGFAVWFQQMDQPRQQRNRIHLDISVPHDEPHRRMQAVLAAGGVLLSDREAPAFWVFADAEGNEACITTWQGRD
jgi:4a-hydroxytetrahydrobiopterin dehydratase